MDEFQKQAMLIALKNMFDGKWFDITVVDSCAKILSVSPPRKDYEALRLLHCVHWSEMPTGFKGQVFTKVMELFDSGSTSFDEMMASRALAIGDKSCGNGFLRLLKSS